MEIKKILKKHILFIMSFIVVMGIISESADVYADTSAFPYTKEYNNVVNYILSGYSPTVGYTGGEWKVIDLARSGKLSDDNKNAYCNALTEYLNKNGSNYISNRRATDNARVILALSSIGVSAENFNGYDLTEPLDHYNFVTLQGISGPIWTLIAMDSNGYEFSGDEVNRDKLIDFILSYQSDSGRFTFDKKTQDNDLTAMAIQALANYQNRADVKEAISKAIHELSIYQNKDGSFGYGGSANCESTSQVCVALATVGINPITDTRFIKDASLGQALISFQLEDGSFEHMKNGGSNQMATEQACLALAAIKRYYINNRAIYDMDDTTEDMIKENVDGKDAGDSISEKAAVANGTVTTNTLYMKKDSVQNEQTFDSTNTSDNTVKQDKTSAKTGDSTNTLIFVIMILNVALYIGCHKKGLIKE